MKNNIIEKEAKQFNHFYYPRIYTKSARAAFYFILQKLADLNYPGILLPSYIGLSKVEGSGVFDPVLAAKSDFDFYKLDSRLRPDMASLESKLKLGKHKVVFLIHYFGIPQTDISAFVNLCRKYKCLVIEDCAHSILGGRKDKPLGQTGDFSIFSIHKLTPTEDGGFFYDNSQLLKNYSVPKNLDIPEETLKKFASYDIHQANEKRFENYYLMRDLLKKYEEFEIMYPEIDSNIVPLNCPVLVRNSKREKVYFKLIERKILTTALYHTLIPQISAQEFADSHFVAKNIINFPTHQDVEPRDLIKVDEALNEILIELSKEEKESSI